jgi:hypothetical protein
MANRKKKPLAILLSIHGIESVIFKDKGEVKIFPLRLDKPQSSIDVVDFLNEKENQNPEDFEFETQISKEFEHIISKNTSEGKYSYKNDFLECMHALTSTGLTKEESSKHLQHFYKNIGSTSRDNFMIDKDIQFALFIDLKRCEFGKDAFEDEPGYRASMEQALVYVSSIFDKQITPAMFVHMHSLATGKIKGIVQEKVVCKRKDINRNSGYDLEFINNQNPSKIKGFIELANLEINGQKLIIIDPIENENKFNDLLDYDDKPAHCIISKAIFRKDPNFRKNESKFTYRVYTLRSPEESIKAMDEIFENYNNKIFDLKNDLDKIRLIADTMRKLEVSHFFGDGNQRTIVFILMNKMLMDIGLSPVILEDPCIFDGQIDLESITKKIVEGMILYREAISLDFKTPQKVKISNTAIVNLSDRLDRLISDCNKEIKSFDAKKRIHDLTSLKEGSPMNFIVKGFKIDQKNKFGTTANKSERGASGKETQPNTPLTLQPSRVP